MEFKVRALVRRDGVIICFWCRQPKLRKPEVTGVLWCEHCDGSAHPAHGCPICKHLVSVSVLFGAA